MSEGFFCVPNFAEEIYMKDFYIYKRFQNLYEEMKEQDLITFNSRSAYPRLTESTRRGTAAAKQLYYEMKEILGIDLPPIRFGADRHMVYMNVIRFEKLKVLQTENHIPYLYCESQTYIPNWIWEHMVPYSEAERAELVLSDFVYLDMFIHNLMVDIENANTSEELIQPIPEISSNINSVIMILENIELTTSDKFNLINYLSKTD